MALDKFRGAKIVAITTLLIAPAALAGGGGHRTLNFDNVTGSRINWNVGEQANNEKEVDFGDFDNDNDLDVVVGVAHSDFGTRKNKLYRNDGGVFNEISNTVPLFGTADVARNAFLRDYDGDGWLDIIIVCDNNTGGDGGRTKLWMNQHSAGVHTGWLEQGNSRLGSSTGGAACGAVSIDNDGDGDFDLYVGNYPGPSQDTMYFNDGNGFFTEMTSTHVPSENDYAVDVSSVDLNNDGTLDLLISNHGDFNYIYYNARNGGGSGEGDYRYSGSEQSLGMAGSTENAMEAGDFDGDGDQDVYYGNGRSGTRDVILENTNINQEGVVTFADMADLPPSVENIVSRKATVIDLNEDNRLDIVVMKESGSNSRPTILRNTSVNGDMSFVDWTPAPAFPNSSSALKGWHSAVFDTNNDGDLDIFVGGWSDDHLFEQVEGELFEEAKGGAGANLGARTNQDPAGVLGGGDAGDVDDYSVNFGSGSTSSIILNGADDYTLELRTAGGSLIASSDRGGLGIEEVITTNNSGNLTIRVIIDAAAGGVAGSNPDLDGSGEVDAADLAALLGAWGPCGSCPEDLDGDGNVNAADLAILLGSWGPVAGGGNDYILEVISRT